MKDVGYSGRLEQVERSWEETLDGASLVCVYEDELTNWFNNTPAIGSPHGSNSNVFLSKKSCKRIEGGLVEVRLTYESSNIEEEEGEGGGGGTPGEKDIITYSLDCSCTDEPLLTHPKFEGIPKNMIAYLSALAGGTPLWETVPKLNKDATDVEYEEGGEGGQKSIKLEKLAKLLEEGGNTVIKLQDKILRGQTSFRNPGVIWRKSERVKSVSCPSVSGVGRIGAPEGPAPGAGSRNWLYVGLNADTHNSGKGWVITKVWEMSGPKKWDTDIY